MNGLGQSAFFPLLPALALGAASLSEAPAAELALVQDGKSRFVILTPAKPDPAEAFAAEELRRYLREMSGAELRIVGEDERRDGPCVSIGATALARKAKRVPEPRSPEDDGFAIHAEGDTIVLAGANPRGTLYAVYDFLERLGCRWFAPAFRSYRGMNERVPHKGQIVVETPLRVLEQPDFKFRSEYPEHSYAHEPDDVVALIDWCAKNKINWVNVRQNEFSDLWYRILQPECAKRGLWLSSSGHGYDRFLPRTQYFRRHPEWFGPIDGRYSDRFFDQFDISNPEALKTFQDNLRDFVRRRPGLFSISAMPNDSPKWADADRDKSPVELLFRMHELIAKTVYETNPNIKVVVSAGVEYFGASGRETFESSCPNVLYQTAVLRRALKYAWNDPRSEINRPQYERAAAATRKLAAQGRDVTWSSRYYSFREISLPGLIYPRQMAEELRDLKQLGGAGVNFNYAVPPCWVPAELKQYLYARLLWNTSRSPEEIMDAYYQDRFPGSPNEMKGFYDALRRAMERYEHPGGGYTRDNLHGLHPPDQFEQGFKDLDEARAFLDAAMKANPNDEDKQLIWLLGASLHWGRGKMEMDQLAQSGRIEEGAKKAADLMDFIEQWDGKGVFYDCVFLRKHLEYRFAAAARDHPVKKRPIENDRLYEYKDYEPGAQRRPIAPD